MDACDGRPFARKYSSSTSTFSLDPDEIERIVVKPSTELIPDEYEHEDNRKGLVVIFYSQKDEKNLELWKNELTDQKYEVHHENVFQFSTRRQIMEDLRDVTMRDFSQVTCFILIVMGDAHSDREDQFFPDDEEDLENSLMVSDFWSMFTSDACFTLRYKPKIFIFQACKKLAPVATDNGKLLFDLQPADPYDIPAEADMLLIYKRMEPLCQREHFVLQLCNNIFDYGHADDLIGIATHTEAEDEKRPLIISTLTRKFYIRASDRRGHYHSLHENLEFLHGTLTNLQSKIGDIRQRLRSIVKNFEDRTRKSNASSKIHTGSHLDAGSSHLGASSRRTSPVGFTVSDYSRPNSASRPASTVSPRPESQSGSSVDSKTKKKPVKTVKQPWKY